MQCNKKILLFDHLVGAEDKRLRNREAEHFGGLEIKNQFELSWLLDGKIGRLGTFEYFVHVAAARRKKSGKSCPYDKSKP